MEVVQKLFKLKVHSVSSTKVFISQFWNAGGSKRADSICVTGTYHPPAFDTSSINAHLSHSKSSKQVWGVLRTQLWIHQSPAQAGTAGPGQHTTLGLRKLPVKNLHTSGKWLSKQLFHKALWKTLFQSHYLALEGVSSGRTNSSWSPGHSWLPIKETHRWAVAIPGHKPQTPATLLQIGGSS